MKCTSCNKYVLNTFPYLYAVRYSQAEAMKFRGKELADAYQAKRDVEEKDKVRLR